MTRPTLALLFLSLATPILGAQEIVGRNERTFTLSERLASGGWVRIASPNGDIEVTQGSGDRVEIRAEKVLRSGDVADVMFMVYRDANELTVCAIYEDGECDRDGSMRNNRRSVRSWTGRQPKINFTVRIPSGAKIKASSGNGDVSVTGAGEEAIIASGNGRVRVLGTSGSVRASSGNGEVTVQDARGPVKASSGNGDIRVTTSLGPVNASSGNGDIVVTMARLTERGEMEFHTGNGRITVTVPSDFGAELESSTGNGSVISDFPVTVRGRLSPSRLRGTLGAGGPRLVLSSGNGNLEIRKGS